MDDKKRQEIEKMVEKLNQLDEESLTLLTNQTHHNKNKNRGIFLYSYIVRNLVNYLLILWFSSNKKMNIDS